MSGICGIVLNDKNRQLSANEFLPMVAALNLWGGDAGFNKTLGHVGIGTQKFQGRMAGIGEVLLHEHPLVLVFHGSLHNAKELFPTKRDTSDYFKKLLELYLQEGMAFLNRLRGEFVLGMWDGRNEAFYAATDRFRVHPLFYYRDEEKLAFASRMKSILACPSPIKRAVDPEAIVHVVTSSIIPTPQTIFKQIKKAPPGHLLTYCKGEITLEPYWQISFHNPSKESETVLAERFKKQLSEGVATFVEADGGSNQIGTYLSGGVDSTSITGILTQLLKQPVNAFSIGYREKGFNEINYARIAARAFNSKHYEYFVTPKDTLDAIPKLTDAFDEPFANASAVPAYYCAKLAKDHGVNFLYAGDGGDELFAGNERYAKQRLFEYYHRIPKQIRHSFLEPIVFSFGDRLKWKFFQKGKKYIQRASIPYHERISSYDFFKTIPLVEFFEDDFIETVGKEFNPYELVSLYYFQAPASTNLDRHLYIDWKLTLSDNDIVKITRTTEATGVTVRYPFLDYPLVEFSVSVPANIKMRGLKLRSFQKRSFADLLPLEIRNKKKHGFGLPIPIWLRTDNDLNELMHDLVLSPQSIQRGYFRRKALENLVKDHSVDVTSFYGTILWNLMVLELWYRNSLC